MQGVQQHGRDESTLSQPDLNPFNSAFPLTIDDESLGLYIIIWSAVYLQEQSLKRQEVKRSFYCVWYE